MIRSDISSREIAVQEPRNAVFEDEDGDQVIGAADLKESSLTSSIFRIQSEKETKLGEVGKQIWTGSLVAADYFLQNPELIEGQRVLELGSGTGVLSIILSFLNPLNILASDIQICMPNLQANIELNASKAAYSVLDFCDPSTWEIAEGYSTFVACDVIYDHNISNGFVDLCTHLLQKDRSRQIYLSGEERIYFSNTTFKEEVHEWPRVLELLKLQDLQVSEIDLSCIPIRFDYERTRFLRLYRIQIPS